MAKHLFGIEDGVIPRTHEIPELTNEQKLEIVLFNTETIKNALYNVVYGGGIGNTRRGGKGSTSSINSEVFTSDLNEMSSAGVFSSDDKPVEKKTTKPSTKKHTPEGVFEV